MNISKLIDEGTYHRNYRVHTNPSSINPALAYALNKIAGMDDNDRILDPCTGTGTILIERQLSKPTICVGVDINSKYLDYAKENATEARVEEITFRHGDITELKFPDNYFTKIISNLPYGIKSGSRDKNKKLYRFLADTSIKWLKKDGKAVFLTNAKTLLRDAFAHNPNWKLTEEIEVKISGLDLSIFIYQKLI